MTPTSAILTAAAACQAPREWEAGERPARYARLYYVGGVVIFGRIELLVWGLAAGQRAPCAVAVELN